MTTRNSPPNNFRPRISAKLKRPMKYLVEEVEEGTLMDPSQPGEILGRMREGFFTLSADWSIKEFNPVAEKLFNKKRAEVVGKPFSTTTYPEVTAVFLSYFVKAAESQQPVFFEASYESSWFSVRAYPKKNGGLAVFIRNDTDKKKAEEEFISALAAKNEFISIASHELKTPLTALKLQVEMAKKSLEHDLSSLGPEKMKQIMNRTHQDIERLSRLVDDMLDASRINTGKFTMSFEFFNLDEFFENLLDRFLSGSGDHKNIFVNIVAPELVRWDRFRIEQVVLNLLTNAIRYGDQSRIELNVTTGGGYAYIEVRDFGPGIPFEKQRKIFERYERGTYDRKKDGLGLGLYISSEIVNLHFGNISVTSAPGEGASFKIQLPLKFETT